MECFGLSSRRLSKEELITGVGGSVLVHVLLAAAALISTWVMPGKPIQSPYFSVNLVSLQDLGPGFSGARKNPGEKGTAPAKDVETPKAASTVRTPSGPVVPIRRLRMDDPVAKAEPEIKKIQGLEAPKVVESSQNSASVARNLDRLIAKPKVPPKPAPVIQSSGDERESQRSPGTDRKPAGGTAPGKATGQGGASGGSEGSPTGSTDGSGRVASALLGMYGSRVKEAINREWAVPDMVKPQGLEARLVVVVNREGKLLDLRIEKRSGNSLFDESAVRAVRKASPLPALPEVITFPKVEIDIRFRPEGLS